MSAKKKANKGSYGGSPGMTCCVSSRPFDVGMNLIDAVGRASRILCRSCQWSEDSDGNWDTACGEIFTFTDGGPKENKAHWCQYCGGELVAVPFPHNVTEHPTAGAAGGMQEKGTNQK